MVFNEVGMGMLLAILVIVVVIGIVIRFLVSFNVLDKKKSVGKDGEGKIGGTMEEVKRTHFDDGVVLGDVQRKKLRQHFSIKAAIDSFKERRHYRWVTAQTDSTTGDGIRSIYVNRAGKQVTKIPAAGFRTMRKKSELLEEEFVMEEDADVLKCIRKTEIFSWFPETIVRSLAGRIGRIELKSGESLYETGEISRTPCYFIVLSGKVSVQLPSSSFLTSEATFHNAQPDGSLATVLSRSSSSDEYSPAESIRKFPSLSKTQSQQIRSEDPRVVNFGANESVTGLSDLLSTISGEPLEAVATVFAAEDSVVLKVCKEKCLDHLFQIFPGLREELLLRILIRLNRVTFMSTFRLTGRVILPNPLKPAPKMSTVSIGTQSENLRDLAISYTALELGLSEVEFASVVRVCKWKSANTARQGASRSICELIDSDTSDEDDYDTAGGSDNENDDDMAAECLNPIRKVGGDGGVPLEGELLGSKLLATVHIVRFAPGMDILEVSREPALYVVLRGALELRVGSKVEEEKAQIQSIYRPGDCFGHLSLLTGAWGEWYLGRHRSLTTKTVWIRSTDHEDTVVARISQHDYQELLEKYPQKIISHKAERLAKNSSINPLIRLIDLTTQWRHVYSGDIIIEEEEMLDILYVVLYGRFQSSSELDQVANQREYGKGAIIGETSFLTEAPSKETVRALRSGQLAAIPKATMLAIMSAYPQVVFHISREMTDKLVPQKRISARGRAGVNRNTYATSSSASVVAIVPASPSAPIDLFLHTLTNALRAMDASVEVLNSDIVERMAEERKLGVSNVISQPMSPIEQMILLTWLSECEDANDIVFYQADPWSEPEPSFWSCLCVEQADLVLFVGNGADAPKLTTLERKLAEKVTTNARRELVLLHIDSTGGNLLELPKNTREWILNRGNIHQHHHIRVHPDRTSPTGGLFDVHHYKSDFRRLSRWLLGESIGLVLGGGGARGLAHIAVIRVLEEHGIPIDYIGGTSIGAYMGASYAMKTDTLLLHKLLTQFIAEMSSTWKKISDLTLPVTSYFSGYNFNRGIVKSFEATKIEDLWIPYFCMSTDLTDSVEIAHRNGSLWRYVRASMTLVNFIPPLCDVVEENSDEYDNNNDNNNDDEMANKKKKQSTTEDHHHHQQQQDELPQQEQQESKPRTKKKVVHYLADGGYMNNLPADVMRAHLGEKATIIAVDVQGTWQFAGYDYGATLSGWKYLWMWLNPFEETPNIPTSGDIATQLAYISSVKQGSTAPQSSKPGLGYSKYHGGMPIPVQKSTLHDDIDLLLVPPVEDIATLEFHRNAEIQAAAYDYAKMMVNKWLDEVRQKDPGKLKYMEFSEIRHQPRRAKKKSKRSTTPALTLHRRSRSWAKLH